MLKVPFNPSIDNRSIPMGPLLLSQTEVIILDVLPHPLNDNYIGILANLNEFLLIDLQYDDEIDSFRYTLD